MSSKTILPPLLNEELIQHSLKNLHQLSSTDDLKIKAYNFKLSPANGENFCSEIYQAEVQYELNGYCEQKSFIIKVMIPEEVEDGTNEEIMLKKILPEMENFLKEINIENDYYKLYPQCLMSKKDVIYVLENLNSLGYFCADRCKGLDLKHAEILMNKMAKFHAASMMFNKKFPEIVNTLLASGFEQGVSSDIGEALTYGGFKYVANMIKNWPSFEYLADKILSIIPKYNQLTFDIVNPKNSKFNVINHADLWINNFLYKYDQLTGNPIDVVFVDFQNCFWGSCGFDINFLFNSSLQLDVLRDQRQKLIEIYYKSLKECLKALKYPEDELPSLEDVLCEIKRCEFIGFYISLCEFPMMALARSQSKDLNSKTFSQPEKMKELRVLLYKTPRVKETLEYSLKYFDEINLFEI